MFCVIGEKILKCEVIEKKEGYAWCKIGSAKKNKSVPYTRLFANEDAAKDYLKSKAKNKAQFNVQIQQEVEKCEAVYQKFFEETGIKVRTIDKKWRLKEAQMDVAQRKKRLQK